MIKTYQQIVVENARLTLENVEQWLKEPSKGPYYVIGALSHYVETLSTELESTQN